MRKEDYLARLTGIYCDIPAENTEKAQLLLENMADTLVMMEECKRHIDAEGCVVPLQQGSYFIERENPYSKIYDAKYRLFLATAEKLNKLADDSAPPRDELLDFLGSEV